MTGAVVIYLIILAAAVLTIGAIIRHALLANRGESNDRRKD